MASPDRGSETSPHAYSVLSCKKGDAELASFVAARDGSSSEGVSGPWHSTNEWLSGALLYAVFRQAGRNLIGARRQCWKAA